MYGMSINTSPDINCMVKIIHKRFSSMLVEIAAELESLPDGIHVHVEEAYADGKNFMCTSEATIKLTEIEMKKRFVTSGEMCILTGRARFENYESIAAEHTNEDKHLLALDDQLDTSQVTAAKMKDTLRRLYTTEIANRFDEVTLEPLGPVPPRVMTFMEARFWLACGVLFDGLVALFWLMANADSRLQNAPGFKAEQIDDATPDPAQANTPAKTPVKIRTIATHTIEMEFPVKNISTYAQVSAHVVAGARIQMCMQVFLIPNPIELMTDGVYAMRDHSIDYSRLMLKHFMIKNTGVMPLMAPSPTLNAICSGREAFETMPNAQTNDILQYFKPRNYDILGPLSNAGKASIITGGAGSGKTTTLSNICFANGLLNTVFVSPTQCLRLDAEMKFDQTMCHPRIMGFAPARTEKGDYSERTGIPMQIGPIDAGSMNLENLARYHVDGVKRSSNPALHKMFADLREIIENTAGGFYCGDKYGQPVAQPGPQYSPSSLPAFMTRFRLSFLANAGVSPSKYAYVFMSKTLALLRIAKSFKGSKQAAIVDQKRAEAVAATTALRKAAIAASGKQKRNAAAAQKLIAGHDSTKFGAMILEIARDPTPRRCDSRALLSWRIVTVGAAAALGQQLRYYVVDPSVAQRLHSQDLGIDAADSCSMADFFDRSLGDRTPLMRFLRALDPNLRHYAALCVTMESILLKAVKQDFASPFGYWFGAAVHDTGAQRGLWRALTVCGIATSATSMEAKLAAELAAELAVAGDREPLAHSLAPVWASLADAIDVNEVYQHYRALGMQCTAYKDGLNIVRSATFRKRHVDTLGQSAPPIEQSARQPGMSGLCAPLTAPTPTEKLPHTEKLTPPNPSAELERNLREKCVQHIVEVTQAHFSHVEKALEAADGDQAAVELAAKRKAADRLCEIAASTAANSAKQLAANVAAKEAVTVAAKEAEEKAKAATAAKSERERARARGERARWARARWARARVARALCARASECESALRESTQERECARASECKSALGESALGESALSESLHKCDSSLDRGGTGFCVCLQI
ncbi:hypothetical protein T492DRAFT_872615 [Pavlovales sp. CCMP2436]|nr:hypothetical protein T492DRAFT_872615 [Pavlovales sp. CCMP2436]